MIKEPSFPARPVPLNRAPCTPLPVLLQQEQSCAENGLHARLSNASFHAETWDACAWAPAGTPTVPPTPRGLGPGSGHDASRGSGGVSRDGGGGGGDSGGFDGSNSPSDDSDSGGGDGDDSSLVVEAYLHQVRCQSMAKVMPWFALTSS